MKKISRTFFAELEAAGLAGLPMSWSDDGEIVFSDDISDVQRNAVLQVYNLHDPALGEQSATIQRIQAARDAAIGQTVSSNALGALHQYSAQRDNIQFLNGLITLGNGGKFTCTAADGSKARRLHTHLQLLALAGDIEAHISAKFDHYELKLAEIAAVSALPAPSKADFDAIVW